MMRPLLASVALMSLAGCVTVKDTYLPDGRQGHAIDCSGGALKWDACYAKAGELCKANGYEIIAQAGDTTTSVAGGPYGLYGASNATRTLLIGCKTEKKNAE